MKLSKVRCEFSRASLSCIGIMSLFFSCFSVAQEELAWPKFFTKDTPGAVLLDESSKFSQNANSEFSQEIGSDCFSIRMQLTVSGKAQVFAENACDYIVKLVRFTVNQEGGIYYFRPDTYIEQRLGVSLLTRNYRGGPISANGHYFKVGYEAQSNTIDQ